MIKEIRNLISDATGVPLNHIVQGNQTHADFGNDTYITITNLSNTVFSSHGNYVNEDDTKLVNKNLVDSEYSVQVYGNDSVSKMLNLLSFLDSEATLDYNVKYVGNTGLTNTTFIDEQKDMQSRHTTTLIFNSTNTVEKGGGYVHTYNGDLIIKGEN